MKIGRFLAAITALTLAGCGAGEASSLAPTPGRTASSSASAAVPPSTATSGPFASAPTANTSPLASAKPTPSADCPAGTLSPAQFLAAPTSCYLSADVAVAGWWGQRRDDEPGDGTVPGWLVRGSMPFGAQASASEDLVFVDEVAAAGPGGWPDGIHWATVTGRGSAADDRRSCHRDPGADVMAPPHCPRYLVASSVVESEPPAAALAACSSLRTEGGWSYVQEFTSYPAACFGTRSATVRGWLDLNYVVTGWEDPWSITPAWLWVPIGPWTVVSPTSNPVTSSALTVYLDPSKRVDASRTNRWVLLTGHYADAAARTCRVVYSPGASPTTRSRVTDAYARRVCEGHFVVTSIRDTTP